MDKKAKLLIRIVGIISVVTFTSISLMSCSSSSLDGEVVVRSELVPTSQFEGAPETDYGFAVLGGWGEIPDVGLGMICMTQRIQIDNLSSRNVKIKEIWITALMDDNRTILPYIHQEDRFSEHTGLSFSVREGLEPESDTIDFPISMKGGESAVVFGRICFELSTEVTRAITSNVGNDDTSFKEKFTSFLEREEISFSANCQDCSGFGVVNEGGGWQPVEIEISVQIADDTEYSTTITFP